MGETQLSEQREQGRARRRRETRAPSACAWQPAVGVKNEREEKDYGLSGGAGAVKGRRAGPMGRGERDERNTGSRV